MIVVAERIERIERTYSPDGDLAPIIAGTVALPNFHKRELLSVLATVTNRGHSMKICWGRAQVYGRKDGAIYFLTKVGKGPIWRYDDGGFVVVQGTNSAHAFAGTFAICSHEPRGIPVRCRHCSLLMEDAP